MRYFLLLIILSSCSLFKNLSLNANVSSAIKRVCLNADGNGRLSVNGHKYLFSYETLYDQQELKWAMSLNFPLNGQKIIELKLDSNESEMTQKIEEMILKDKKGVDPIKLEKFMKLWAIFVKELIFLKEEKLNLKESNFKWKLNKKRLVASKHLSIAYFNNYNGEHFGKMDFVLGAKSKLDKILKIELIVRKCLDKTD